MGKASGFGHPIVSGFRGECCWISAILSSSHQGCLLKMSPNLFVSGAGVLGGNYPPWKQFAPQNGWLGSMKCPLNIIPCPGSIGEFSIFQGFSLILRQQKIGEINAHFQGPAPATLCWCDPYLMNLYFQMQVLAVSLWFGVIWLGCWWFISRGLVILRVWMRMSLKMFEVQFEACFWLKKMYDVT